MAAIPSSGPEETSAVEVTTAAQFYELFPNLLGVQTSNVEESSSNLPTHTAPRNLRIDAGGNPLGEEVLFG